MSLLWPYGLVALAGVPAAIIIALWRARRRDYTVPSLMLWQRLAERISDTGRRRRKLVYASLVLAAVFAALLGAAIAGPMLAAPEKRGRTILLVVDRSASMNARQGGTTRWKLAMRELSKLLGELTPADAVYLATSPPGDPVRVGPLDPDEAGEKLKAMQPTYLPGYLAKDVSRALASAQALKPFQAIVCTDDPEVIPAREAGSIAAIGVGGPADNLFFTRFGFSADKVLVGIRNAGKSRTIAVGLEADGTKLRQESIRIDGGSEETLTFRAPELSSAGWIEVQLDADDSLTADNRLYAARSPEKRIRVLFIGKDNLYLEEPAIVKKLSGLLDSLVNQ